MKEAVRLCCVGSRPLKTQPTAQAMSIASWFGYGFMLPVFTWVCELCFKKKEEEEEKRFAYAFP